MLARSVAILAVAIFSAGAQASEESGKKPIAVSKEVYDKVRLVDDAAKHLETRGISIDDIEPGNLGFQSTTYDDCLSTALQSASSDDEKAIAFVACFKRHPLETWSDSAPHDAT